VRELSDTQVYSLSLHAPALARRRLIEYRDALEPELYDDVSIVTSELVSNAVLHSGKAEGDPITVTTSLAANVFRIEVIDWADVIPVLRPVHERRSGLSYVAIVSDRWAGSTTTPFSVWAEFDVNTNGLVRRPALV
jgi:two-component sensor histidine kinase